MAAIPRLQHAWRRGDLANTLPAGQLQAVDNEPELAWRLARREAHDSLSALVQTTQRELSAVETLLLLRRGQLDPEQVGRSLVQAAAAVESALLETPASAPTDERPAEAMPDPAPQSDTADNDLSPWALRRLTLATGIAAQLRHDADEVLRELESAPSS